jgi:SAM-dependent methyltransferase
MTSSARPHTIHDLESMLSFSHSMAYADITVADHNPVKRWLQRRRFADAIKVLRRARLGDDRPRVLDFGAGDGELVRQMASVAPIEASVFEPTPSLMAEAREKLARLDSVVFAESLDSLESGVFDYVFCLEVFEHLPEAETAKAIAEIHRLLKPSGMAVIGVPHELFLPAILKGVFRMFRRYGDFDARPGNILSAFWGRTPSQRPIAEICPGHSYHFHHLGFDYRRLERSLQEHFCLAQKWFSPFSLFGAVLNSEVYFLLKKGPTSP